MTAAAALALPGSRVLLGWWREFADRSPRRVWFAHLLLHRIEACVEVEQSPPLPSIASVLLSLLATPRSLDELAGELHMERSLLSWLLGRLSEARLLERNGSDRWLLTPAGQESLHHPSSLATATATATAAAAAPSTTKGRAERRVFWFADSNPPMYLPLQQPPALPLPPPAGWTFDPAHLEACMNQPAEHRRLAGFPPEVHRLLRPEDSPTERVILDRAEQLCLLLTEIPPHIHGFAVRADTWQVQREPAVLTLGSAAALAIPGAEPTPDAWRQAWRTWCQPRSLPASEVEGCKLEIDGHLLRVSAPVKLVERLRAARSEALKGEAWILAGSERVRAAAALEIHEVR